MVILTMTKPIHPVELLACAIATQEGWFAPGTLPVLRNNPGDLDFAGQIGASKPAAGSANMPIAIFASCALGVAALFRQIWLQVAEGQSVRQLISQWDNSPTYLADVLAFTGLPADVPVLQLLPPLVALNGD